MSFILDALKKSESERNRHTGPVLMDVRIAAPRRRVPVWLWIIGTVLVANLAVLAWLLLRNPPATQTQTAAAAVANSAAVLPAGAATIAAQPAPVVTTLPVTVTPESSTQPIPAQSSDADLQLPSVQDLAAAGVTLPALQLNLHVYDANPVNRYVLLNSARLHEGDFTPEGIKVERITPTGVILESRGRRFVLNAGG